MSLGYYMVLACNMPSTCDGQGRKHVPLCILVTCKYLAVCLLQACTKAHIDLPGWFARVAARKRASGPPCEPRRAPYPAMRLSCRMALLSPVVRYLRPHIPIAETCDISASPLSLQFSAVARVFGRASEGRFCWVLRFCGLRCASPEADSAALVSKHSALSSWRVG